MRDLRLARFSNRELSRTLSYLRVSILPLPAICGAEWVALKKNITDRFAIKSWTRQELSSCCESTSRCSETNLLVAKRLNSKATGEPSVRHVLPAVPSSSGHDLAVFSNFNRRNSLVL